MSRLAKIKVALQGIPDLPDPISRVPGDAAVADLQWTVGEIERLQEIMHKSCEIVRMCGHADICSCCWCDMRRLFAAESAGGDDG